MCQLQLIARDLLQGRYLHRMSLQYKSFRTNNSLEASLEWGAVFSSLPVPLLLSLFSEQVASHVFIDYSNWSTDSNQEYKHAMSILLCFEHYKVTYQNPNNQN